MKFTKPPLTFEQQADLLLGRGLVADRDTLIQRLKAVNYYRLSGYLYEFRDNPGDGYQAGTTLDAVWRRYTFDRRLRVLIMDVIERIEVSTRTHLAYHFAHTHGPFAYTSNKNLPHLNTGYHQKWLRILKDETDRSKEPFVQHFFRVYGDQHPRLPIWVLVEITSFGSTMSFLRGVEAAIKQQVAREYGIPDAVLLSWMLALNETRNACAHHARLWNRNLGYQVKLPLHRKYPEWHEPVTISNNDTFAILTICRYLLGKIAPQSNWKGRLADLIAEYPELPPSGMGFPENWQASPLWA
ncbi:MAG: Abi family protein [Deferrisomatales bacterium]|nr:Abi family protein [Deferrisomatales bacterium]